MDLMTGDRVAIEKVPPASSTVGRSREVPPASSTVKPYRERVAGIERQRQAQRLSHAELLRRARVDKGTWQDARRGRREPRTETLDRLEAAFAEAPLKKPPQIVKAYMRLVMLELCRRMRLNAEAVLATDFTVQRPNNPAWLAAARVKQMAVYITAVELELENAELGRAIGETRANIKKARDQVFDRIETSKKIEQLVFSVSALVTGRTV